MRQDFIMRLSVRDALNHGGINSDLNNRNDILGICYGTPLHMASRQFLQNGNDIQVMDRTNPSRPSFVKGFFLFPRPERPQLQMYQTQLVGNLLRPIAGNRKRCALGR